MSRKKRDVERRRSLGEHDFPLELASGDVVLEDRRSGVDRRAVGIVAEHPMFFGVQYEAVEEIYRLCETRFLEVGEQLLSPGVPNHHLFIMLEGQMSVHIDRPDSEAQIAIGPGECVGEVSIIDRGEVTAYVIAAQPCTVLAIPEEVLWQEMMRYPSVARNFMRQSAERFRARNQLMQQAIEERVRYEALEKELGIAADIQTSMLPRNFNLDRRIDIDATMTPARHVGGDFFDVFQVDERMMYVAIGDVAGKGVAAALFVVKAMTVLRIEMMKSQSLEEAAERVNKALCEDNERCMFVTLAIVVIDPVEGRCRYLSAGHNPAALGRNGAGFVYLEPAEGIVAGVMSDAGFSALNLEMSPGDVLLLYTDGVTEAMDCDRNLYGETRLLDCLNDGPVDSASGLIARVTADVYQHADGAARSDDLTMLAVRFLPA